MLRIGEVRITRPFLLESPRDLFPEDKTTSCFLHIKRREGKAMSVQHVYTTYFALLFLGLHILLLLRETYIHLHWKVLTEVALQCICGVTAKPL